MLLTCSDSIRRGETCLPVGLATPKARGRFTQIASVLPACISVGTFEHRLDASDQIDYQVCFNAREGAREKLTQWFAGAGAEIEAIDPTWARALSFLRLWSRPGSMLHEHSPAAWLEFDCRLEDPQPPLPFAFFSLHPPWADISIPFPELLATVDEGFDQLAGGRLDAARREQIHHTLRNSHGRLIHAALRPVGDTHVARLIIRMPVAETAASLERLGWGDTTRGFAAFVERYCTSKLAQTVQLDVTADGIGPRVGIEFFYESSPLQDRRWQELFDKLIADGACTTERRSQVEAWVGTPTPDKVELVLRSLLIKVVYVPDAPLEAKAYLPFCVNPLLDSLTDRPPVNR